MRCKVRIVPVGDPPQSVTSFLLTHLKESDLKADCYISEHINSIGAAYNPARNQYMSTAILKILSGLTRNPEEKVLGVTELDLYVPGLNFVFGEALYNGVAAVISTYRLSSTYAGGEAIMLSRAAKEAIHELGHTLGLPHCVRRICVMSFSNNVFETDIKGEKFCKECKEKLQI
ncbi:MAG: archaemetzincin family Zn-dependent metalloprotease [Candidatus Bathyarchaeia archaeon]